MKKGIVRMRKTVPLTLLALVLSIVMASVGRVSPIPTITQANPVTTVYLDLPTINGTMIDEEFNVSIMIRDASEIFAWNAGLIFNATLLNCTGFEEGEFLSNVGSTGWVPGTINNIMDLQNITLLKVTDPITSQWNETYPVPNQTHNLTSWTDVDSSGNLTDGDIIEFDGKPIRWDVNLLEYGITSNMTVSAGVITAHGSTILGDVYASGDGRLAYATFKVKALHVSDIHLSDVKVLDYDLNLVQVNIIDVYTVVSDTTRYTVVTVSNLTGATLEYVSGFYDHAFNPFLNETSFKVAGPYSITDASGILEISGSFSNVTIPKALLPPPDLPRVWAVLVNGTSLNIEDVIKSENATHTSVYFMFPPGINDVQITTRFMPSTISIALSEDSIPLGESVTISGNVTGADDEVRANVDVTIQNRTSGTAEWDTLATVITDQDGEYTYEWEPEAAGTYEVKASWLGDEETLRDDSDVLTLKVKGKPGIPLELVAVVVVAIIVIVAIVVYFVKIRKPKS